MRYMTVHGKYRIYEDGVLVSERSNVITTNGKKEFLSILAGVRPPISTLLLGTGATTASASDTSLNMPVVALPVVFRTPLYDGAASKIVYKSRLPESYALNIYEIGATNSIVSGDPLVLSLKPSDVALYTSPASPVFDATGRIDGQALKIGTTDVLQVSRPFQLGSLAPADEIVIAGTLTSPLATNSVEIRFTDASGLQATKVYSFANNTSYQYVGNTLSSYTAAAGFDWSTVIGFQADMTTGTAGVTFFSIDGVSIRSESLNGILMSRMLYTTPPAKRAGSKMDIEYEITWSL